MTGNARHRRLPELLKSVVRRIVDRRVLHLIKMWLECPVEETDDRGRTTRTTEARDKRCGIPLYFEVGTVSKAYRAMMRSQLRRKLGRALETRGERCPRRVRQLCKLRCLDTGCYVTDPSRCGSGRSRFAVARTDCHCGALPRWSVDCHR